MTVLVTMSVTICGVNVRLQPLCAIRWERQRLVHRGGAIADDQTPGGLGLVNETCVHIVPTHVSAHAGCGASSVCVCVCRAACAGQQWQLVLRWAALAACRAPWCRCAGGPDGCVHAGQAEGALQELRRLRLQVHAASSLRDVHVGVESARPARATCARRHDDLACVCREENVFITEGAISIGHDRFEDMLNVRVACGHCQKAEFEAGEPRSTMPVRGTHPITNMDNFRSPGVSCASPLTLRCVRAMAAGCDRLLVREQRGPGRALRRLRAVCEAARVAGTFRRQCGVARRACCRGMQAALAHVDGPLLSVPSWWRRCNTCSTVGRRTLARRCRRCSTTCSATLRARALPTDRVRDAVRPCWASFCEHGGQLEHCGHHCPFPASLTIERHCICCRDIHRGLRSMAAFRCEQVPNFVPLLFRFPICCTSPRCRSTT